MQALQDFATQTQNKSQPISNLAPREKRHCVKDKLHSCAVSFSCDKIFPFFLSLNKDKIGISQADIGVVRTKTYQIQEINYLPRSNFLYLGLTNNYFASGKKSMQSIEIY